MTKITGAKVVIETLIQENVEVIFGYPGGAVLPIYDEIFKQKKIRHILVRHEQAVFIWVNYNITYYRTFYTYHLIYCFI